MLERYFHFYKHQRPHQALGYRMPADLFPRRSIKKRASPRWGALPRALSPKPPGNSPLFCQNGCFLLFRFEKLPYCRRLDGAAG
ncbi:MAG: transposase [Acidobacteriia bacterium]|nr:transposase [Terriglobia bacterium]